MRGENNTDAMASSSGRPLAPAEQWKAVEGALRSSQLGKPAFPGFSTALSWQTNAPGLRNSSVLFPSFAFAWHFSFAVANDPEKFTVRHFFEGSSVTPVAEFELHVRGEVAFAVAGLAMTHCAVVAKEFAHLRQAFRRRRDGVLLRRVFARDLGFRGTRLFLRCIRLRGRRPKTGEQNRTHNGETPAHAFLLTVRAGRRSGFGLILNGFYAARERKERIKHQERGGLNRRLNQTSMV